MVKCSSVACKAIFASVLIALGFVLAPVSRAAEYANKLPRVVFVPGILGSAIAECNSSEELVCSRCFDGSPHKECKIIWGPKGSQFSTLLNLGTTDLHLDPTKRYVASPIDELAWNKVYYDLIMSLKNLSPDANLYHPFGYDWRRSVVENAGSLSKFVCDLQQKYPEAPHSMGGLVVRYLLDFSSSDNKCTNGIKLNLLEVLYVATPHQGSVKSVFSLLSGFRYFLDDSWYAPLNGLFGSLNKAGPTFQSLYELFPVRANAACQRQIKELRSRLDDAPVQLRDSTEGIDIFSPAIWSDFSLYSALTEVSEMKDPQERLPELLTRAGEEVCELEKKNLALRAKSDEEGKEGSTGIIDEFYYYGLLPDAKTPKGIIITRNPGNTVTITPGALDRGDGTVTTQSAKNWLVGDAVRWPVNRKGVGKDHISIINDSSIIERIRERVDRYRIALQKEDEILTGMMVPAPSLKKPVKLKRKYERSMNKDRTSSASKISYDEDELLTPYSIGQAYGQDYIKSRIHKDSSGLFQTETLTLGNFYAALRYLDDNKFSPESRLVISEFLGRYYYYIGLYKKAYTFSSFVVEGAVDSPVELLLPPALAVLGWSSLRLGKSEQSKESFLRLGAYSGFFSLAAAGLVATDYHMRGMDWEEPVDWLHEAPPSLSTLQNLMAVAAVRDKTATLATATVVDAPVHPVQTAAAAPQDVIAVVPAVSGAPGDGGTSLSAAMKKALGRQGIKLASEGAAGTYKVQGQVELGAVANGQQPITIRWVVIDPSGKQMERTIIQNNKISAGSLDGAWGEVAEQAAGAAASEVTKLLIKGSAQAQSSAREDRLIPK